MSPPRLFTPQQLRDAYRRTRDRIAQAALQAGRRADDVLLVAVTKYAAADQVRLLVELGQRDLGESRAQQLTQRVAQLDEFLTRKRLLGRAVEETQTAGQSKKGTAPPAPRLPPLETAPIRWHMIGHLQRNKVKQVVPLVRLIHSVDSLRLAEELHAYGARTERVIEILLEVNASGETSKFGITPPATPHVAEQIDSMLHLKLRGLMTVAPYSANPEDARPTFARTAELFHELKSRGLGGGHLTVLSMGMSHDFETAISEGANLVRIGAALFGEHPPDADGEEADPAPPPDAQDEIAQENRRARKQ